MSVIISLSPTYNSFPFISKRIPVAKIAAGAVTLGVVDLSLRSAIPLRDNGWFSPHPNEEVEESGHPDPGPLSVSSKHAQFFIQDSQVFIRDLDSAYGTFVNDVRLSATSSMRIKSGDVIRLGTSIPRNKGTPAYVTNEQLRPIIARVELL